MSLIVSSLNVLIFIVSLLFHFSVHNPAHSSEAQWGVGRGRVKIQMCVRSRCMMSSKQIAKLFPNYVFFFIQMFGVMVYYVSTDFKENLLCQLFSFLSHKIIPQNFIDFIHGEKDKAIFCFSILCVPMCVHVCVWNSQSLYQGWEIM